MGYIDHALKYLFTIAGVALLTLTYPGRQPDPDPDPDPGQSEVIVNVCGSGRSSGSGSIEDPIRSIAEAVEIAGDATMIKIHVAPGYYKIKNPVRYWIYPGESSYLEDVELLPMDHKTQSVIIYLSDGTHLHGQ